MSGSCCSHGVVPFVRSIITKSAAVSVDILGVPCCSPSLITNPAVCSLFAFRSCRRRETGGGVVCRSARTPGDLCDADSFC